MVLDGRPIAELKKRWIDIKYDNNRPCTTHRLDNSRYDTVQPREIYELDNVLHDRRHPHAVYESEGHIFDGHNGPRPREADTFNDIKYDRHKALDTCELQGDDDWHSEDDDDDDSEEESIEERHVSFESSSDEKDVSWGRAHLLA
ncbi:hypothetical protein BDV18DRAFT_132233 [Aspergillus unguis]